MANKTELRVPMNCRQARIDLALCVGEDLPEPARRESLRRHVTQCPGCRAHYKRLRSALRVLESADDQQTYDVTGSLWPQVSNRIRRQEAAPPPTSRFNGWLPFVAVTAACAMLVVAMETPPSHPAPGIARDMFGISSILTNSGHHDTPQPHPAFLRVGTQPPWSPEMYEADHVRPNPNDPAGGQQQPPQRLSTVND